MKFIIGKKLGMSQVFAEDGTVTPVTVIEVEQNVVTHVKNKDKDGYEAVQIGTGPAKKSSKPQKGHFKELGGFKHVKEFKTLKSDDKEIKFGDKIDASVFVPGDIVKATGISKGKGFAGAVKRYGFKGMPASHGHHSVMRHVGSIGQRFPQHTLKGMRMAGRTGNATNTVRGLKIIRVEAEKGLIAVKGAVPGNIGGLIMLQSHK
jgi:large subunit ribosomal protein L3